MKKFIYATVQFLVCFVILSYIIEWFYEKEQRKAFESGTSYRLIKWNSIKDSTNKYDIIVLGSSRGYSALNPLVIDSVTKMNSFNMCTSAQQIIESIYVLDEILKYQKPKYLIFEIALPAFLDQTDYYQISSNAKFMSNKMIMDHYLIDECIDIVFPIYKYKPYFWKDFNNLFKLVKDEEVRGDLWYKGYKPISKWMDSITIANISPVYTFSNTSTLSKDKIEYYIEMLKEKCIEHDVQCIFVRVPYPPSKLEKSDGDEVNDFFRTVCNEKKITFYDLNYESVLNYLDSDFENHTHMNIYGAKKTSIEVGNIINDFELKK